VWVQDLHHARDSAPHRLPVAGIEVGTQRKVVVDDLREVELAELAERLD
jgi:hypothetical protein